MNSTTQSIYARQYRGNGYMTVSKFNHSGKTIYIADKDSKTITAISTNDFATITNTFSGHNGVIWGIAISDNDETIYSCSGDMTLCVWKMDIHTSNGVASLTPQHKIDQGGIPKLLSVNSLNELAIYVEPLGKQNKPKIRIYDENMNVTKEIILQQKITTLNWLNNNELIQTFENGTLIIENINTDNVEPRLCHPHTETIKSVIINKNKTHLLTASTDKFAHMINLTNLTVEKTFISNSPINFATFICNEKKIVLGGGIDAMSVARSKTDPTEMQTKIYNVDSQKLVLQIQSHFGPIRFIDTFGKLCATASQDGLVKIHYIDGDKNNDIRRSNEQLFTFDKRVELHQLNVFGGMNGDCLVPLSEITRFATDNGLEITKETATTIEFSNYKLIQKTGATTIECIKTDLPTIKIKETKAPQKPIVGLAGSKVKVYEPNVSEEPIVEEKKSICVQNLPRDTNQRALEDVFSSFGKLDDFGGIKVIHVPDKEINGKIVLGDTIAFINYSYTEGAEKAIKEMYRARFGQNIISIDYAKGRKE